jgi:nitrogenase molybdenum-iron protein NifN
MAKVITSNKACSVNPLKMSQPVGGALAFMGVKGCMPLLHGSQGCTSFGLVLLVRHFREAIPLQTTAMSEVATVLGGLENVQQAVLNIANRAKPEIIGICSTGVTETKGDDVNGFIKLIRARHPELDKIALVYVSTPDFKGAFQDGWAVAVNQMVETIVEQSSVSAWRSREVNVLPGCHMTPGDIEELREIIELFGLRPHFLPDLSGSLDGHIPDDFTPTTLGGISVAEIRSMGSALATIAIGEQMRGAAISLEHKTGVPYKLFGRLTGLSATDDLMGYLAHLSGTPANTGGSAASLWMRCWMAISTLAARISPLEPSRICCGVSQASSLRWAAMLQQRLLLPPHRCSNPYPRRKFSSAIWRTWSNAPRMRTCSSLTPTGGRRRSD